MTRSTRKTMLLLLMLLGIVYLVLHALVRTGAVQEMTASYLESRTGYAATVGAVRFTPGLSLLLRDVSLQAAGHAGATNEVFRAPYARLQPWCRRRIFWAQRAEITLRQAGNGVWEPAFVPETEISRSGFSCAGEMVRAFPFFPSVIRMTRRRDGAMRVRLHTPSSRAIGAVLRIVLSMMRKSEWIWMRYSAAMSWTGLFPERRRTVPSAGNSTE